VPLAIHVNVPVFFIVQVQENVLPGAKMVLSATVLETNAALSVPPTISSMKWVQFQ